MQQVITQYVPQSFIPHYPSLSWYIYAFFCIRLHLWADHCLVYVSLMFTRRYRSLHVIVAFATCFQLCNARVPCYSLHVINVFHSSLHVTNILYSIVSSKFIPIYCLGFLRLDKFTAGRKVDKNVNSVNLSLPKFVQFVVESRVVKSSLLPLF